MTSRDVTLLEVAKRANVHPSTVSRALGPGYARYVGEATRQRILLAAEELRYQPNALARGLRKGRTGMIGVIVVDFEHMFTAAVLRGIEGALESAGMMPLVTETHESSERLALAFEQLLARRADAVITTAVRYGDERIVAKAADRVPVVLAVRTLAQGSFPTIAHDDIAGGAMAASHLLELGHERFAELGGPLEVSSFAQRHAGFHGRIAAAGAKDPPLVSYAKSATFEEGKRLAAELLATCDEPPTAVFAHNDHMAVGAVTVFAEAGLRCPSDVSVLGYDDMHFAEFFSPPLTTVRLPSFHLGRLAAEMATSLLLADDSPAPTVSLPPSLVVRLSTAPPRRAARRFSSR